jgi:dihydroorotase
MRAFVGEPGASHRETFASASQAAASGGITTIICQPDTSPVIDNSATVDFVLRRARDTAIVNIHPMAALTKGMRGEEMTEIGLLKAAGAVAFTDGDKSVTNAQVMRRALIYAGDFDALIVHHTEDPDLNGDGDERRRVRRPTGLLSGMPKAAETIMLERDMRLVDSPAAAITRLPSPARNRWRCCAAPGEAGLPSRRRPRSTTSRSTKTTSARTAPS